MLTSSYCTAEIPPWRDQTVKAYGIIQNNTHVRATHCSPVGHRTVYKLISTGLHGTSGTHYMRIYA